jgi:aldehyde dehydrogenase (NAD+)
MSSLQARVFVEALHEADRPKGVLNVMAGLGTVVAELVHNSDVAKISFTGSVAVGEALSSPGYVNRRRNL